MVGSRHHVSMATMSPLLLGTWVAFQVWNVVDGGTGDWSLDLGTSQEQDLQEACNVAAVLMTCCAAWRCNPRSSVSSQGESGHKSRRGHKNKPMSAPMSCGLPQKGGQDVQHARQVRIPEAADKGPCSEQASPSGRARSSTFPPLGLRWHWEPMLLLECWSAGVTLRLGQSG